VSVQRVLARARTHWAQGLCAANHPGAQNAAQRQQRQKQPGTSQATRLSDASKQHQRGKQDAINVQHAVNYVFATSVYPIATPLSSSLPPLGI
jgi:hypothetical protein